MDIQNKHPLQELLAQAGLPTLSPELLEGIVGKEGSQFEEALRKTIAAPGERSHHRAYLAAVLTACVPATRTVINALGFQPVRTSVLIDISKAEGAVFANAVRAVSTNPIGKETESMRQYLSRTLSAVATMQPKTNTPNLHDHAQTQSSNPANPGAAHQQSASSRPAHQGGRPNQGGQHQDRRQRGGASVTPINSQQQSSEKGEDGKKFGSFHLYGGKAAFCFNLDETRRPAATVRIEAAKASGTRQYDWKNKTPFQLTESELPLVFGVLFGLLPRVELVGHGHENEKSLTIEQQGEKFFLSMRVRGGDTYAMPAPAKDTYPVMVMLLTQMMKNAPSLSSTDIKMLVRRVCEMHAQTAERRPYVANA